MKNSGNSNEYRHEPSDSNESGEKIKSFTRMGFSNARFSLGFGARIYCVGGDRKFR
jgi:hypothetical protein